MIYPLMFIVDSYVCLDNNTRAQYRARELKSIKVNADGEYVRLVIRNCHRNRLNTYNQVIVWPSEKILHQAWFKGGDGGV